MKQSILFIGLMVGLITINYNPVLSQNTALNAADNYKAARAAAIDSLKKLVEKNPDNLTAHQNYIYFVGLNKPLLQVQYKLWMSKYPKVANVPLALGEAYCNAEMPEAKTYLLKAVQANPRLAEAWRMLALDADRQGDDESYRKFMETAISIEPNNAVYTYEYTNDFEHTDTGKWRAMMLDFVNRYPGDKLAPIGLYLLAEKSTDTLTKINLLETLKSKYPPLKFSASLAGMEYLFNIYLETSNQKAVSLATEMHFKARKALAQNLTIIDSLVVQKQYDAAFNLLKQTKMQVDSFYKEEYNELFNLKEANINYKRGNVIVAYDSLVHIMPVSPSLKIYNALQLYGSKLGKSGKDLDRDIWISLNKCAKQATKFTSKLYTVDKRLSLDSLKGKVVLLTFWFPGCGPCRQEFDNFENVLSKFNRQQIAYLAININPGQDGYVLDFIRRSKVTFTPLHGTAKFAAKAYGVTGEPANFLIDQQGQIIFSDFRIDDENETTLELMIKLMLEKAS